MSAAVLEGGFADAPREAAFAFRALMSAMARPGRVETIKGATPPAPLSGAAGTVLLTMADPDTPVHLAGDADTEAVRGWLAFHCGAPLVGRGDAVFALGTWEALLPLGDYAIGTPEYPDRSATLVVEMPDLTPSGVRLTGPGIETEAHLSLPDDAAFVGNGQRFPLGLDFFFTCGDRVAALPRTTRIG